MRNTGIAHRAVACMCGCWAEIMCRLRLNLSESCRKICEPGRCSRLTFVCFCRTALFFPEGERKTALTAALTKEGNIRFHKNSGKRARRSLRKYPVCCPAPSWKSAPLSRRTESGGTNSICYIKIIMFSMPLRETDSAKTAFNSAMNCCCIELLFQAK